VSEQENIHIVRRWYDNFNNHKLDLNDAIESPDLRVEASGSPGVMNRDQATAYNRQFLDAFPDLHFDLKDIVAQGDRVAVNWVARGTHKAPLTYASTGFSLPPTNRMATVPGSSFFEIRNNKIVHSTGHWDQLSLLTQLGVLTEQDIMSYVRR
jgi:steroid delta-isomerase-like uncharacterized protein